MSIAIRVKKKWMVLEEDDIEDLTISNNSVHILFKYNKHPKIHDMGKHGRKRCYTLKNTIKYINYEYAKKYSQRSIKETIFRYSGMIFDDVLDKFSLATSNVQKLTGDENIPRIQL